MHVVCKYGVYTTTSATARTLTPQASRRLARALSPAQSCAPGSNAPRWLAIALGLVGARGALVAKPGCSRKTSAARATPVRTSRLTRPSLARHRPCPSDRPPRACGPGRGRMCRGGGRRGPPRLAAHRVGCSSACHFDGGHEAAVARQPPSRRGRTRRRWSPQRGSRSAARGGATRGRGRQRKLGSAPTTAPIRGSGSAAANAASSNAAAPASRARTASMPAAASSSARPSSPMTSAASSSAARRAAGGRRRTRTARCARRGSAAARRRGRGLQACRVLRRERAELFV